MKLATRDMTSFNIEGGYQKFLSYVQTKSMVEIARHGINDFFFEIPVANPVVMYTSRCCMNHRQMDCKGYLGPTALFLVYLPKT